jgi:peptidoglycan/LPS O-acetylase OafA/YrhL
LAPRLTGSAGEPTGPFAIAATAIPSLGWSGVDLFFVLSGFLIIGVLLRAKGSKAYYRSFYARRILRIFPLYYAALILFLLVIPRLEMPDLRPLVVGGATFWYWLFLTNVKLALGAAGSYLTALWSLAVEEHFYLLWPWIVNRTSERQLLRVCGAIAAGALALRVAVVATDMNPLVAYAQTPCRLDTLAVGTVWARMHLVKSATAYPPEVAREVGMLMRPEMQTLGYSLLCVAFGSLVVKVLRARPEEALSRCFTAVPRRSLGLYSYSTYLLHIPVIGLVMDRWRFGGSPLPYLAWQLGIWLLTRAAPRRSGRAPRPAAGCAA